jgi:hypothetical protein
VGVGNIMLGAAGGGLGMPAIGRQGAYLSGESATMRFNWDPVSFGLDINSIEPNSYRIGIGCDAPTAHYRVRIVDGLEIGAAPLSPTGTALYVSEGAVVINDLSGSGYRAVEVDPTGQLVAGSPITGSVASKYATTFTPGTVNVANTITHGLGTTDISVTLWDVTAGDMILAKIDNRTSTTVDVTFTTNPAGNVRIVVIG